MKSIALIILVLSITALATLQAGIGYNTPVGTFKTETDFPGGASFSLGSELKIAFVGLGAEARYHILGDTVGNVELPDIPGVTYEDVTIKSFLLAATGMVRLYPVDNNFIALFGELGFGYYHRGVQVQDLPVPTDLGSQDGMGFCFGAGGKLLPISPIKPMLTVRYEIGNGVGRNDLDALQNPDSNEKKNATLMSFLLGVDLF